MSSSIGSFSGIGSGFDYSTLVDQLIQAQSAPMTAMQSRMDAANAQLSAYKSYRTLLGTLETAAKSLRDGTAFQSVSATVAGNKTAAGLTTVTASASAGTAPGSYAVQVLQTAAAEKLSGTELSGTNALGLSGDFLINDKTITIAAADTLSIVRDKINAANAGSAPSGVAASIVSNGTSQRIVLTSQKTGSTGINLVDGAQGVARQIGWIDATAAIKHATSNGARSDTFTSSSASIASQLGLTIAPGAQTISIGGQSLSIDLSTDSLDSIASKINTLTGVTASVQSTTANGATTYALDIRNTTSFVDAGNTLEQLGVLAPGRSSLAQTLTGGTLTAGDASTPATGATLLTNLWTNGSAGNAQVGDTLTINGARGDGSAVSVQFTIGAGSTVQNLLNAINDATTGFGAGTRPATASIDASGHIVLTDNSAGASALSLQIVAHNEGGGQLDLGTFNVTTAGRSRQLVGGADAKFTVDGVLYTRTSNTVTDVVGGATLSLTTADPTTTATVTVDRSASQTQAAVQSYVDAYNKLIDFVHQQQTAPPSGTNQKPPPLYSDPLLRSARNTLPAAMLATITGAAPDMATAGMIGLALTKDGHLSLDTTKFNAAFTTRYDDLQKLFAEKGSSTNTAMQYVIASDATQAGTYAVNITQAATQAQVTTSGFSGTYANGGGTDTFTVTDTSNSTTVQVHLTNGMTTSDIVDALNTAFASGGTTPLNMVATATGNQIAITHTAYGSAYGIQIGLTGDGTDPLAQLGMTAGTVSGADVAGTIGGNAATGRGQQLTGATGTSVDGLTLAYTDTATGAIGSLTLNFGVGAAVDRLLNAWTAAQGVIASKETALNSRVTREQGNIDDFKARMEVARDALLKKYLAMDVAVQKFKSQGSAFLSAISSATNNSGN